MKTRTQKSTKVAKREDRKKTRTVKKKPKQAKMGRKKIQIARIMDERNRHVSARKINTLSNQAKLAGKLIHVALPQCFRK